MEERIAVVTRPGAIEYLPYLAVGFDDVWLAVSALAWSRHREDPLLEALRELPTCSCSTAPASGGGGNVATMVNLVDLALQHSSDEPSVRTTLEIFGVPPTTEVRAALGRWGLQVDSTSKYSFTSHWPNDR